MFDKLIESELAGADVKNRRKYFMVSSVVVGVLFTTAVVISIFAADFGLGNGGFELTEIMAPVEMAAAEPERPQPRPPVTNNQSQSQVATRQVIMAITSEPTIAPTTVSTTPNTQASRPQFGDYKISDIDSDPVNPGGTSRTSTGSGPEVSGLVRKDSVVETEKEVDPPPPVIKAVPAPPKQISLGVINGKAEYLQKPVYSAAAKAVGAQGQVNVQVTIDENGRVISAKAVDGNVILRPSAEQAARNSRFTPTLLSKVPVKVTGVIVYNFTR